jgi:uncharacterized DUF497 family protein
MDFEWDEDKRLANLRKHRVDFVDVPAIFDGDTVMVEDDRYNYGERDLLHLACYSTRPLLSSILKIMA